MRFFKVINSLILGVLLYLLSGSLYATPVPCIKPHYHHPHRLYLDLGVGKTYDYARSNSFLENNRLVLGNLNTLTSYSTPFFFIGLGYQWTQDAQWFPYLNVGLQHRYTAPINVAGNSNTTLNTTNYTYHVQQESWLIMTKADIYKWKRFMPYLTAGMGVSFNRMSQLFVNTSNIANQLSGSTTLSGDFSYSFGGGIDFIVKDDFWLSLGYFFDDFGKNSIDKVFANGLPIGELRNANLHANSFYLKARYLFA
jgi:opacity protein-like surface antigen